MKATRRYLAVALILASTWANSATWVEVEGQGATVDEAKQNGFRQAIRNVVGQLIISDIEVSGDQVTKDFIGDYSAGYIEDYEIQNTYYDNQKVTVHMFVNVANSKIAERMRTNSNHKTTLSGEKLQEKIDSILEQRNRGDRILSNVLNSYPYNAYVVNSGATTVEISSRRQVYIEIPYEIRWSRYWLEALSETLGAVSLDHKSCKNLPYEELKRLSLTLGAAEYIQEKICGNNPDVTITQKKSKDWLVSKQNYYFQDLSTLDTINGELRSPMGQQHVGLVVELKDASGGIVDTRCARIPTELLLDYTLVQNEVVNWAQYDKHLRPKINGQNSISGTLRIHAKNINLTDVNRLDMHLEKTCL